MATVYLARELHPKRPVAIKVLVPEIGGEVVRKRFLREVELASQLIHPHIVPVFSAGEVDGMLYYVMPFIEGESLRQRISKDTIAPEAALQIAGEIASALDYAHGAGVIHRDIKPENVLLPDGHAMVADFGIARGIRGDGTGLTIPGLPIGTPRYMSPEQLAGLTDIDGRADVFSLGCVLFEALGGRWPSQSPPVPSDTMRDADRLSLPPTMSATPILSAIRKAMDPDRNRRFATAGEFAAALGVGRHSREYTGAERPGRIKRINVTIAVVAVLAIALGLLWPSRGAAPAADRVVVSVFENRTGDERLASVGAMAADWITQGLSSTGLIDVVGFRTALATDGQVDSQPERLSAFSRETGARYVVWGSYYQQGDRLSFSANVTDGTDGRLLRALEPLDVAADSPLVAVNELRRQVSGALATILDDRLSGLVDAGQAPPAFEAYREYVAGMREFLQLNQPAAVERFLRAAAADSSFTPPLLMAAFAHATINQYPEADSLAQRVASRRDRLAPADAALLDWITASTLPDRARALASIRRVVDLAPGAESDLLHGLTALSVNRVHEGLAALERVDVDRGFGAMFFLYWNYYTSALHILGRHREELSAARDGLERFPDKMSIIENVLRVHAALGNAAALERLWPRLLAMPPQAIKIPGDVMRDAGLEAYAHGHEGVARNEFQRSVNWYRSLSDQALTAEARRYGLARSLYQIGEYDEARRLFTTLRDESPDSLGYAGYLGAIAARTGDSAVARQVVASLPSFERPYLFGAIPYWQARILAILGDTNRAVTRLVASYRQGREYSAVDHFIRDLESLWNDPRYVALMRPVR